ncbi:hypothetical protein C0J52_09011 [Blattella germanica]|nr:hypothetical protein C0J52_09011 [Blattella germanica]
MYAKGSQVIHGRQSKNSQFDEEWFTENGVELECLQTAAYSFRELCCKTAVSTIRNLDSPACSLWMKYYVIFSLNYTHPYAFCEKRSSELSQPTADVLSVDASLTEEQFNIVAWNVPDIAKLDADFREREKANRVTCMAGCCLVISTATVSTRKFLSRTTPTQTGEDNIVKTDILKTEITWREGFEHLIPCQVAWKRSNLLTKFTVTYRTIPTLIDLMELYTRRVYDIVETTGHKTVGNKTRTHPSGMENEKRNLELEPIRDSQFQNGDTRTNFSNQYNTLILTEGVDESESSFWSHYRTVFNIHLRLYNLEQAPSQETRHIKKRGTVSVREIARIVSLASQNHQQTYSSVLDEVQNGSLKDSKFSHT